MKIAVLGAGAVGSTIGRLWHAAGHDVTFAARHAPGRGRWRRNSGSAHTRPPSPTPWRPPKWYSWPSRAPL
jgi:glycine/D-amino acid oxidase-like deaminating enzyme